MNTKTLLAALGVVIIVGAAIFFMKGTDPYDQAAQNQQAQNQKTSLKALMMTNEPQRCTFTNKVENSESSGTVYLMRGRMRGDFTSMMSGRQEQGHMIIENDQGFFWSDSLAGKGMMMHMSEWEGQASAEAKQQVDLNAEADYTCNAWSPDESVFQRPSNVEFMDIKAMMQGGMMMQGEGSMKGAQCAQCDTLGEPAKTQCKTALGC